MPNLRSNILSDLVPNSNGVVSSGNPTISEVAIYNKYFFISRQSRTFKCAPHNYHQQELVFAIQGLQAIILCH